MKERDQDDIAMWACLCHFSALLGLIWWMPMSTIWIPFGHLVGPLVVWLLKRKESTFIDEAGRESLNFQLTMTLYGAVFGVAFMGGIGKFVVMALVVVDGLLVAQAGIAASRSKAYRYPLIFRRML